VGAGGLGEVHSIFPHPAGANGAAIHGRVHRELLAADSGLADPPSYSSVRGMLRLLEEKGHVTHEWDGPRHVYLAGDPARLRRDAVRHFVRTFFNDSTESAVVALRGPNARSLTREQLDRLGALIEQAKKGGGA
jgi:predicted transcriptional regulator